MNQSFITGFVKRAVEQGLSEQQGSELAKSAFFPVDQIRNAASAVGTWSGSPQGIQAEDIAKKVMNPGKTTMDYLQSRRPPAEIKPYVPHARTQEENARYGATPREGFLKGLNPIHQLKMDAARLGGMPSHSTEVDPKYPGMGQFSNFKL